MSTSSSRKRKHDEAAESDESIESLSPNDVLLGRGQHVKNEGGNSKFRALVRANSAEYNSSRRKGGKDVIARRIIQAFLADGGRFVKRKEPPADSAMHEAMLPVYELADEATVLVKVKQTMRDYSVVLRKAAASAASANSNNTAAAALLQPNPINAQTSTPTVAALHSLAMMQANNPAAAAVLQFSTTDQLLQMLHQAQQQETQRQQQLQQAQQQQAQQQQLDALRAVLSGQPFNASTHDNTATTQSQLAFLNNSFFSAQSSYPQQSGEHDSVRMEIPPSMGLGGESSGTSTSTQLTNSLTIPLPQPLMNGGPDGRAAAVGGTDLDANTGPGHDPHMHALLLALMQGSSSTNVSSANPSNGTNHNGLASL